MRGQRQHWYVSQLRIGFETAGRFPTIDPGQSHVHQDQIRLGALGQGQAWFGFVSSDHFIAPSFQVALDQNLHGSAAAGRE
jgi:hypothetical protein